MHNTFRRRLVFIILAALSIWVFLLYTHSLVDRLESASRRNCETIARLWAGVQYPLSMIGDPQGIMSCTVCGSPGEFHGQESELRFCSACGDTTLYIRTARLLPEEREDIIVSTRRLFADVVNRLDFPTIFSDKYGHPQIVDGAVTDGFDGERIETIRRRMEHLSRENEPVPLLVRSDTIGFLYYGTSELDSEMSMMPFLELGLLLAASAVIFIFLRSEVAAERNMSWIGFARETAHQLSTPLSSLMGWLQLLEDDRKVMSNPETAEAVAHMNADVERLASIAGRYGQMGREPKLTQLRVWDIVEETVDYFSLRKGLLGSGVILEKRNSCPEARIMGNGILLGWVLENLIKNAVAACASSPGGGLITVECARGEGGRGDLELRVSDNGTGIPYSDQGKVFNPGFTTRKGGWGLGLSLARRIVEEYHGGNIRLASSVPGEGTSFVVTLPGLGGDEADNHSMGG